MVSSIFLLKNIKQKQHPLAVSSPGVLGCCLGLNHDQKQSQRSAEHKAKPKHGFNTKLIFLKQLEKTHSDKAFYFVVLQHSRKSFNLSN